MMSSTEFSVALHRIEDCSGQMILREIKNKGPHVG